MKKLVLMLTAVVFVVGCSSKKKADETTDVPAQTPTADTSAPMSYDPTGSDSGSIAGLVTVHFEYDRANLTSTAKKDLTANADWIKSNPKATVQVEGHCDNRGTIEYNLALGERRAQAVKNYLVGMGIAADRLNVISYGEEKPVLQGDSEEAWAKNRRANFVPMVK